MSIKVTQLPDAEPRDRSIAIGTFDGVHVGHRKVIEGADTVLTFEPHPLSVIHPGGGAEADHAVRDQARRDRGARRLRARRHPLRRGVLPHRGGGLLLSGSWSRRSAPRRSRSARTSASARRRRATRRCSAPTTEFETRVVPLVEVAGETVSSTRIRAQVAAGDVVGAMDCLGAPFLLEGTVVSGDKRGRTLGFPTANIVPDENFVYPGHGVYAAFADGHPGGGQRRRPAHLRDGPRGPDRDLPHRPGGGPLRARPCGSRSSPACGAKSASAGSRSSSPRCIATWTRRASSVPSTRRLANLSGLDAPHQGKEAGTDRQARPLRGRHRLRRGPGRAA